MGGYGSGCGFGYKKNTVEDCSVLDINKLVRDKLIQADKWWAGTLTWTRVSTGEKVSSCEFEMNTQDSFSPWIRLKYRINRTGKELDYKINLETTVPNYGGIRWWFTCPLIVNGRSCHRRVAKLYLAPGSAYYGCRHCHNLTYTSCQDSHKFDRLHAQMAASMGTTPDMVRRAMSRR